MLQKIKKIFWRVLAITEWLIFAVLIFTFLVVLSPILPTKRYIYTYIVASGSMEQTIKAGSIALVKPANILGLKKGDIITFNSPKDDKQTILHRIYEIKKKGKEISYSTKGDNNNAPDAWTVPSSSIKGEYVSSVPYLGHIGAFLKTKKGFMLLIGMPALILVLLQIKMIKEGIEEEVKKRTAKAIKEMQMKKMLALLLFLATLLSGLMSFPTKVALAQFQTTAAVNGVSISVIDFIPPSAPVNLHYENPNLPCGGTTNGYTITTAWDASAAHGSKNISYYEYESYYKPTDLTYQTTVTATKLAGVFNQGDGLYGYRVRAVDNLGYKSEWSQAAGVDNSCTVTYDHTLPQSIISPPNNGASVNPSTFNVTDWDGNISGTASDNLSGVQKVELSIKFNNGSTDQYWDGLNWQPTPPAEETSYRMLTNGTAAWNYQLNNRPNGTYTITSHATDNAGNMENSYVITLIAGSKPASTPAANLSMADDKKTASFSADNIAGFVKLSYTLTYDTYGTQKGITGTDIDISQTDSFGKNNLDLATCSAGVCTYDENISAMKLQITLTDKEGKQQTLEKEL